MPEKIIQHLYFHIPFCAQICPYCAFYKHTPGKLANAAFVEAILSELAYHSERYDIKPKTLYFGGGTPSLLSRQHLDRLLTGLRQHLDLASLEEFTFEANPATYNLAKAQLLRDQGVTRISLGVQSWHPQTLKLLGREHSAQEAKDAYHILREAGFDQINIDLMFSVPGQSLSQWREDLQQVLALQPEHISAYNLTYEEDTDFFKQLQSGRFREDQDEDADQFHLAIEYLEGAGYDHYEISNYARKGARSRHNQAYWAGKDYIGVGPGAVSTVGYARWKNVEDTASYVRQMRDKGEVDRADCETLSVEQKRMESIALQLRTEKGVTLDLVESQGPIDRTMLLAEALIFEKNEHVYLTQKGKSLADMVALELIG
ncbi:MAG: radical SAM family heme chaperone HemW [Verrucomicrobiales bacterium]|nr:radical SAM family heme chaperone HemW [Verrucomicrobiales bacterium]